MIILRFSWQEFMILRIRVDYSTFPREEFMTLQRRTDYSNFHENSLLFWNLTKRVFDFFERVDYYAVLEKRADHLTHNQIWFRSFFLNIDLEMLCFSYLIIIYIVDWISLSEEDQDTLNFFWWCLLRNIVPILMIF